MNEEPRRKTLDKARSEQKPLENDYPEAYKKGTVDFYGREFFVSPEVLIPRPETEMAVDAVLTLAGRAILPGVKAPLRRLLEKPKILDVGTGSGCIAVTLAKELPEAEIEAVDLSEKALRIAQKNARKFEVLTRIKFYQSNLLEAVFGKELSAEKSSEKLAKESGGKVSEELGKKFDVIVANLPYIDKTWEWLKEPASAGLKYEPETALYAEQGGLELIFKLIEQARGRARWLVLEADPCQHERIVEFAKPRGWELREVRGFQVVLEAH